MLCIESGKVLKETFVPAKTLCLRAVTPTGSSENDTFEFWNAFCSRLVNFEGSLSNVTLAPLNALFLMDVSVSGNEPPIVNDVQPRNASASITVKYAGSLSSTNIGHPIKHLLGILLILSLRLTFLSLEQPLKEGPPKLVIVSGNITSSSPVIPLNAFPTESQGEPGR